MDQRRVNVRAIVYHEQQILAVKHKNKDGSASDYWALPGGGLEPMETLQTGLMREIQEETGKIAKVGQLLLIQQFKSTRPGQREELEFFFLVKNWQDFTKIDLAKSQNGADELAEIAFINPRQEFILPTILSQIDLDDLVASKAPLILSEL